MKNRLLALAGVLAILAICGTFYARPLMAQIRAAFVLNVDNPGRIPYQSVIQGTTGQNCSAVGCGFTFPAVPSGHRLVIEHVSAIISPNANAVPAPVNVGPGGSTGVNFFATVQGGFFNEIRFDQPVLLYIDAGQSPVLTILPASGLNTGFPLQGQAAVLFGYLLDCNAGPCAAIAH